MAGGLEGERLHPSQEIRGDVRDGRGTQVEASDDVGGRWTVGISVQPDAAMLTEVEAIQPFLGLPFGELDGISVRQQVLGNARGLIAVARCGKQGDGRMGFHHEVESGVRHRHVVFIPSGGRRIILSGDPIRSCVDSGRFADFARDESNNTGVMSLPALLSLSPLTLGGPRKRLLMLGNRPLARLQDDPQHVSALIAHVGGAHAFTEIIATLVGNRPSAILAIQGALGEAPVAVHLQHGELHGLVGGGPLDQLGPWAVEFQRRHGIQWEAGASTTNLRSLFLYERLLEAFRKADRPGSSLAFLQGALSWLGDEDADPPAVITLQHVLLEYARRKDELPRVEAKLGGADRVVVPMCEPGDSPGPRLTDSAASMRRRDFDVHPDEAANQEWLDARRVFRLCDGALTVEELAETSMLGRFRTYSAVVALAERSHVRLAVMAKVGAE